MKEFAKNAPEMLLRKKEEELWVALKALFPDETDSHVVQMATIRLPQQRNVRKGDVFTAEELRR
ncbi:hypothetical protein SPFM10_00045 [Salmonella phage SPFM10]|nr:hypothetical protein SPFM6_00044 [Salmonella phage SPFM6]VFR12273.1 hypothetical protein SPFM10_00045 [Salmonella phage SPFM10]